MGRTLAFLGTSWERSMRTRGEIDDQIEEIDSTLTAIDDSIAEVEAMPAGPAAAAGAVPAASPRGRDACAPSPRGDAAVSFVPLPASRTSNKSKATSKVAPSDAPTAAKAKADPAPAVNMFKRSFMFGTSAQGGELEVSDHMLASLDEAFRFFDIVCATLLPASYQPAMS